MTYSALLTVNVFVFMGNMYSVSQLAPYSCAYMVYSILIWLQSGIATGFGSLAAEFHTPFSTLADLVAYSVLAMGLANLFWMPLALTFGKRPIVIISMAMFLGGIIWSAVAKDYNSLFASRVFASFGINSFSLQLMDLG